MLQKHEIYYTYLTNNLAFTFFVHEFHVINNLHISTGVILSIHMPYLEILTVKQNTF